MNYAPNYAKHRVTTKAVLFDKSRERVLLVIYEEGRSGLPGGHVDYGELPDDAIVREIDEELGIASVGLEHLDFQPHEDGKIVLGYYGIISEDHQIKLSGTDEISNYEWVFADEILTGELSIGSYDKLIMKAHELMTGS